MSLLVHVPHHSSVVEGRLFASFENGSSIRICYFGCCLLVAVIVFPYSYGKSSILLNLYAYGHIWKKLLYLNQERTYFLDLFEIVNMQKP